MRYDSRSKTWLTGGPKTANSILEVPLTQEAVSILMKQKEQNKNAAPRMGQQKLTICGAAWYDGYAPKGAGKRRCYIDGG